jgi:hypothetical protein
MAMRETVRSLRAYFILSALLSGGANLWTLVNTPSGVAAAFALIGLGFSAAYLYLAFNLRRLLATNPPRITNVLIAGAVFLGLLFVLDLLSKAAGGTLPVTVIGLLITWYLFVNVRRLAAETQSASISGGA